MMQLKAEDTLPLKVEQENYFVLRAKKATTGTFCSGHRSLWLFDPFQFSKY